MEMEGLSAKEKSKARTVSSATVRTPGETHPAGRTALSTESAMGSEKEEVVNWKDS